MLFSCQKSCETCGLTQEELQAASFRALALQDVGGDETLIETPYGMRQEVLNAELQEEIHAIIQKYARYMEEEVFVKEEFAAVKKMCKNRHRECAYWTQQGSCETVSAGSFLLSIDVVPSAGHAQSHHEVCLADFSAFAQRCDYNYNYSCSCLESRLHACRMHSSMSVMSYARPQAPVPSRFVRPTRTDPTWRLE
jgi:hypothetical protein